jgi:translation initiation factor eIF-2B subunit gamma
MPHALSMPSPGFQAIILCGPGVSFTTFTSNPEDFPKALIPIANRPMVWYPLDFCYRMGITGTLSHFSISTILLLYALKTTFP